MNGGGQPARNKRPSARLLTAGLNVGVNGTCEIGPIELTAQKWIVLPPSNENINDATGRVAWISIPGSRSVVYCDGIDLRRMAALTEQLQRFSATRDPEIADAVLREVFEKLHEIAAAQVSRERHMAVRSPTELINDAWVHFFHKGGWEIHDREHFFAFAANAMRMVLVDKARRRLALRRGGGEVTLSLDALAFIPDPRSTAPEAILEIGRLMDQYEKIDPQATRVIEMKYFAGFTFKEIATITGLKERQISRRWTKGMGWLRNRLKR